MIKTGARKLMRRLFDNGWSFEDACHELGLSSAGSIAEHRAVWDGFSAPGGGVR